MVKSTILANPFTPKSGIEPKAFIGREKEIRMFEQKLDEAIKLERFDHFLVLGEWGVGKTSLLKEFKKIAQVNKILCSYISIRSFQENDTFLDATKHLAASLTNLPVKYKVLKDFTEYLKGMELNFPFIGGGVQISDKKELQPDPQVLLIKALKKLWNSVKKETKSL
ncbi:MAG: ATP-binding protein, partial [Candidatus Aminicenantes bacterium]